MNTVKYLQIWLWLIYDNWLAVDKVIAKITRLTVFGPPCIRPCDFSARKHHRIFVQRHCSAC